MAFEMVTLSLCREKQLEISAINSGYCFDWAQRVRQRCPAAEIYYVRRFIPHAFILFAGRWFDATAPLGVTQWQRLPLFRPLGAVIHQVPVNLWMPGDKYW
ncbi:hypothetical protein [Ferrimonas aestuarii]|uniref:Uncharacterized protein n=1 Tax=Ferrimonas aestuarii TaxID=2569539 RepID=A0A4U1BM11_9GAMM|nr:hypothetical protein [Ferrimonas aestuarii]TKB53330.1 hypothetical protein FCL42_14780 [Ferrimonas aestuarii]